MSTQSIHMSTVHTQESQTFSCAHCVHTRNHYALIRFVQTHTQTIAQMSYTQHAYLYMSLHPPAGSTLPCTHTQKSQLCWCRFGSSCFHLTDIHQCLQTEQQQIITTNVTSYVPLNFYVYIPSCMTSLAKFKVHTNPDMHTGLFEVTCLIHTLHTAILHVIGILEQLSRT